MMIRTRLIKKHRKDCTAVQNYQNGTWHSPWAYIGRAEYKNCKGYGRGMHTWRSVQCNHYGCPAEVLLNEEDILKAAHINNMGIK